MNKITGAKAWIWALTILVGVGGIVYGEYQRMRAQQYIGYKEALKQELRAHNADMKQQIDLAKACNERQEKDAKTIKALTEQRDRIAKKLWIGKGANVTINVVP